MSHEERGADYFERHPDSVLESLQIASDGEIFPGTAHGKNAAENYAAGKKLAGVEVTIREYTR